MALKVVGVKVWSSGIRLMNAESKANFQVSPSFSPVVQVAPPSNDQSTIGSWPFRFARIRIWGSPSSRKIDWLVAFAKKSTPLTS